MLVSHQWRIVEMVLERFSSSSSNLNQLGTVSQSQCQFGPIPHSGIPGTVLKLSELLFRSKSEILKNGPAIRFGSTVRRYETVVKYVGTVRYGGMVGYTVR